MCHTCLGVAMPVVSPDEYCSKALLLSPIKFPALHYLQYHNKAFISLQDVIPEPSSELSSIPQPSPSPSPSDKPMASHAGRKQRILSSMVSKLQHMAVKSRMIQRAAEKVSKQSLILTVTVKSLDGYLAVNMAPPPSDALW